MGRILYYLLLRPLSLLPLSRLYPLSAVLSFLLYRLGFRRKVVLDNLRRSFPAYSERDVRALALRFYRHFADLAIEGIRMFSMSREELVQRMRIANPELLDPFYEAGKNMFIVIGHYNNWEYLAAALAPQIKHRGAALYTPLSNAFFNAKWSEARGKYGLLLVSKHDSHRFIAQKHEEPVAVVMGADQSPTFSKHVHWTTFLGQDTAVMLGTEVYAKRYGFAVVFAHVQKIARGYYEATFSLLEDNAAATAEGDITERHARALEADILRAPEFWLWTHRRWKRKRKI